jgi:hypothetical protein
MSVAQFTAAMRPAAGFFLNARYRYSDVDIQTPVFDRTEGSIAYDTNLSKPSSPSEYHSVKRSSFDIEGAFTLTGYSSIKAAYSRMGSDYTHRIWETTNEDVFKVSVDSTGSQRFMLRAQYENRQRTGDGFEPEALADVGELPTMRHFDIADRDRNRFTFIGTAPVTSDIELNASIGVGRDEYTESQHGPLVVRFESVLDRAPTSAPDDRFNLLRQLRVEDYSSLQRSRNASDAVQQADPKRDWTTDYTGKVNYFEAGFDIKRHRANDDSHQRRLEPIERHLSLWPRSTGFSACGA